VERMGDRRVEYRVWVGRPDGKRPLERSRPRWDDNFKMDLQQMEWGETWTGLMWPMIGIGGGRLCMRQRTFGFRKMRGISGLAQNRLAFEEVLCSLELAG